jgi:hypothetical protein
MRYHIKENAGNTLAEKQKQKPHTHVIWDDMNMEFKGGWNRMSLVEMLDTQLYPIPPGGNLDKYPF